jgi:S1-C subfamily serine protease
MNSPEPNYVISEEPAPEDAVPAPPARARVWPAILITAVLSGLLSAAGTFVAFSVQSHGSAVPAATASPNGSAQVVSLTQSDAIIRVVQLAQPSVVTIDTTGVTSAGRFSVPTNGVGSGFIVSSDGLIVTNNHVIAGSNTLSVTLDDGSQHQATVVKTDAAHDLAVIKIDAQGLTPLTLGDSSGLQVGQLAIAIGSPLGEFTDSVTQGIVSGLNRSITIGDQTNRSFSEDLSGLIQTDAAINPGNSGGPLLDASGNVIGVVVASSTSAQDMGFAIPINQVKTLIAAAK